MARKIAFILFLSFYSICLSAQNEEISPLDSAAFNALDHRFVGGKMAFFKLLMENIVYPVEARENCRQGVSLVRVKLRPTGVVDSIQFQNDIAIGMGIEDEILRCVLGTKGKWLRSINYPEFKFSIAFSLNESDKLQATVFVTGHGISGHAICQTIDEMTKALAQTKKKKDYKEAIKLCEDLLRRMPNSELYKKELVSLKKKVK